MTEPIDHQKLVAHARKLDLEAKGWTDRQLRMTYSQRPTKKSPPMTDPINLREKRGAKIMQALAALARSYYHHDDAEDHGALVVRAREELDAMRVERDALAEAVRALIALCSCEANYLETWEELWNKAHDAMGRFTDEEPDHD